MTPRRTQQRTHRSKGPMNLKKGGCFSGIEEGLLPWLRPLEYEHAERA